MQMAGREGAASVLQLPACRADGGHAQMHMRLLGGASAFFQIAGQAGRGHIFPTGPSAKTARDDMVKGQIVGRAAILAFKLVAQEQVKARECRIFRRLHILAQRNDARDLHVDAGAVDMAIIAGDNIHLVKEHGLDRGLPRPQAQRVIAQRRIVRVQDKCRAIVRVAGPSGSFKGSDVKHSFALSLAAMISLLPALRYSILTISTLWPTYLHIM